MAMYTQVKNTAGYVGLNALEYIMQTVRVFFSYTFPFSFFFPYFFSEEMSGQVQSLTLRHRSVLQRRTVRVCTRAVRHELPRDGQRDAFLLGPVGGHRGAVRGRELSGGEERGDLVVGGGGHLVGGFGDGVLARGDEGEADVLERGGGSGGGEVEGEGGGVQGMIESNELN